MVGYSANITKIAEMVQGVTRSVTELVLFIIEYLKADGILTMQICLISWWIYLTRMNSYGPRFRSCRINWRKSMNS